jgi:hypothetical protein
MNTNQTKECTCGCHTSESSSEDMKKNGCDLCYCDSEYYPRHPKNKPTKEEMKQKENIQTGDLVSNNQNLDTILQEADKDFEDFYWETGKYNGRDLGIDGYKDFIHSNITKAYEAGCDNGKEIYKKAHKLAMERGKQQTIKKI